MGTRTSFLNKFNGTEIPRPLDMFENETEKSRKVTTELCRTIDTKCSCVELSN